MVPTLKVGSKGTIPLLKTMVASSSDPNVMSVSVANDVLTFEVKKVGSAWIEIGYGQDLRFQFHFNVVAA